MVGEARVLPPGWSQPAGQYEGWNGQYPQQGWDGQNPQQGWDPTQYPLARVANRPEPARMG